MKYCVKVCLQCIVEADSVDEAVNEAMEQATTFVDDVDYVEAREVCLVEEQAERNEKIKNMQKHKWRLKSSN